MSGQTGLPSMSGQKTSKYVRSKGHHPVCQIKMIYNYVMSKGPPSVSCQKGLQVCHVKGLQVCDVKRACKYVMSKGPPSVLIKMAL